MGGAPQHRRHRSGRRSSRWFTPLVVLVTACLFAFYTGNPEFRSWLDQHLPAVAEQLRRPAEIEPAADAETRTGRHQDDDPGSTTAVEPARPASPPSERPQPPEGRLKHSYSVDREKSETRSRRTTEITLSKHAEERFSQRSISKSEAHQAISSPDQKSYERAGKNGGDVWKYEKRVGGRRLVIVAEATEDQHHIITGYWDDE